MGSDWLLTHFLHYSAVFSSLFVLVIMVITWRQTNEKAFIFWASAFGVMVIYQFLHIAGLQGNWFAEFLQLVRAVLMGLALVHLIGRRYQVRLAFLLLTGSAWIVFTHMLGMSQVGRLFPLMAMVACSYLFMALFFFRTRPDFSFNGHALVAFICLLSAIVALVYPFALSYGIDLWTFVGEQSTQYLLGVALGLMLYRREQVRADESALFHERILEKLSWHRNRVSELDQWADVLLAQVSDGVLLVDLSGKLTSVNPAAERIFGYQSGELEGHASDLLLPEASRSLWRDELRLFRDHRSGSLVNQGVQEWSGLHRAGHDVELEITVNSLDWRDQHQLLVIVRDVSIRKHHQQEISWMADHDGLTDLPNRRYFETLVEDCLAKGLPGWLMFIDMDDFKIINDTLGHEAGDLALKTMARRLGNYTSRDTLVGRQGGDEFVLFFPGERSQMEVVELCEQVIQKVTQPVTFDAVEFVLSCSLGVAGGLSSEELSFEQLIRHADLAMYQAKHAGKNRYCFYHTELLERFHETAELASRLKNMDMDDELYLVFQPRMVLDGFRLDSAEALLRWRSPDGNEFMPARFIPVAEETGQIVRLGYWVFEQVCNVLARGVFPDSLVISVNLSARQLFEENLIEQVEQIRTSAGVPASRIEFEVTESSAMQNIDQAVEVLTELRSKGYALALDDFGTGFSSLSHLRRMPVDVVKIDRSFTSELVRDQQDRVMVASIIELAEHLDMRSLAEGVETREQLQLLDSFGCDEVQGYYISRPVEEQEFIEQIVQGWHLRDF